MFGDVPQCLDPLVCAVGQIVCMSSKIRFAGFEYSQPQEPNVRFQNLSFDAPGWLFCHIPKCRSPTCCTPTICTSHIECIINSIIIARIPNRHMCHFLHKLIINTCNMPETSSAFVLCGHTPACRTMDKPGMVVFHQSFVEERWYKMAPWYCAFF